jgi:hypothetical protein
VCLQVKAVCSWEVQPPPLLRFNTTSQAINANGFLPDGQWEVVQLLRKLDGSDWWSPSLKARWAEGVRKSLSKHLVRNLVVIQ